MNAESRMIRLEENMRTRGTPACLSYAGQLAKIRQMHREEIERLQVDRDSWAEQASDRVRDWDNMRQRAEEAEAQAAMRQAIRGA